MASYFKSFGDNAPALFAMFFFIVVMMMKPAHAQGGFAGASERTAMCAATAGTISEANSDERCPSPITTKDGREFCPQHKPTEVCALMLAETEPVCEFDSVVERRCEIVTPGQAVGTALEEQLQDAE